MPGRSGKPLFELMSSRAASAGLRRRAAPPPGSTPAPEPKGAGAKAPLAPASGPAPGPIAGASSERSGGSQPAGKTSLTIPTTTAYVGVVVILGLCLLSYVLGYSLGERAGRQYMMDAGMVAQTPGLIEAPITDPTLQSPSTADPQPRDAHPSSRGAGAPPERRPGLSPTGTGEILSPEGRISVDPREAGVNYLQMGDLPGDQAESAIAFFAAEGEIVIGVPLEDRAGGSKDRFRLFSLTVPIPSERWSEMGPERREHLRRVADIGRRWQREQRGGSDFASAYYAKYSP